MKKFNGYEETQAYTEVSKLPVGGYVLKIMDASVKEYSWGSVLIISFDVAEGEYKGFYAANYKAQNGEDKKWKGTYRLNIPSDDGTDSDTYKKRRFKTVINAIEDSNAGFHWAWDETKLKGKTIGGIFNNKEYEYNGNHGFYTNCYSLVDAETIRSGKFKIPDDTMLKERNGNSKVTPANDGFMNIPEGEEDLPFN